MPSQKTTDEGAMCFPPQKAKLILKKMKASEKRKANQVPKDPFISSIQKSLKPRAEVYDDSDVARQRIELVHKEKDLERKADNLTRTRRNQRRALDEEKLSMEKDVEKQKIKLQSEIESEKRIKKELETFKRELDLRSQDVESQSRFLLDEKERLELEKRAKMQELEQEKEEWKRQAQDSLHLSEQQLETAKAEYEKSMREKWELLQKESQEKMDQVEKEWEEKQTHLEEEKRETALQKEKTEAKQKQMDEEKRENALQKEKTEAKQKQMDEEKRENEMQKEREWKQMDEENARREKENQKKLAQAEQAKLEKEKELETALQMRQEYLDRKKQQEEQKPVKDFVPTIPEDPPVFEKKVEKEQVVVEEEEKQPSIWEKLGFTKPLHELKEKMTPPVSWEEKNAIRLVERGELSQFKPPGLLSVDVANSREGLDKYLKTTRSAVDLLEACPAELPKKLSEKDKASMNKFFGEHQGEHFVTGEKLESRCARLYWENVKKHLCAYAEDRAYRFEAVGLVSKVEELARLEQRDCYDMGFTYGPLITFVKTVLLPRLNPEEDDHTSAKQTTNYQGISYDMGLRNPYTLQLYNSDLDVLVGVGKRFLIIQLAGSTVKEYFFKQMKKENVPLKNLNVAERDDHGYPIVPSFWDVSNRPSNLLKAMQTWIWDFWGSIFPLFEFRVANRGVEEQVFQHRTKNLTVMGGIRFPLSQKKMDAAIKTCKKMSVPLQACVLTEMIFFKVKYSPNVALCTLSTDVYFKEEESVTWPLPLLDVVKGQPINDLFSLQLFSRIAVDPAYVPYS
jgi:hypothetical protein